MSLPPISNVVSRFRWVAVALTCAWSAGIVMLAVREVFFIYTTRHSPPTKPELISSVHDVGGLSRWGAMPDIVLWSGNTGVDHALLGDPYTPWNARFKTVDGQPPPFGKLPGGLGMAINMSKLYPVFHGINRQEFSGPSVTIQLFDPTGGTRDIQIHIAHWHNGTCERRRRCTVRVQAEHFYVFYVSITKSIVPLPGVYWGWPWEGSHTREEYVIQVSSRQKWKKDEYGSYSTKSAWFTFQIPTEVVLVSKPISILSQVGSVAGKAGGQLTLLNAVFFIFFTRKYRRGPDEDAYAMLTIRLDTQEEYKKVESEQNAQVEVGRA